LKLKKCSFVKLWCTKFTPKSVITHFSLLTGDITHKKQMAHTFSTGVTENTQGSQLEFLF